jgi:hypothetical protein
VIPAVSTAGFIWEDFMSRHTTIYFRFIFAVAAAITLSTFSILAQPTAIGPGVNTSQAGELSYFTLKVGVKAKTLDIVNEVNRQLAAAGHSARVELNELKGFKPRRQDTVFLNRPNSTIVRTPFIVRLKVKIPVAADRYIAIPLDLDTACDGWQTGNGRIAVHVQPGPPSFEGGSIIEDILQVRNFIDAQVRNNFPQLTGSSAPLLLADPRCRNLGVTDFGTATIEDDAIHFDRPGRRPIVTRVSANILPSVEIKFDRLKRLQARDLQGRVLYQDAEQIALNAFANYEQRQKLLTMREGDDVELNLTPVVLNAGLYDKLVVLGTVEQPPNNDKDSAFRTSLRTQNYQPGTYTLRIPKYYVRPADSVVHHPTFVKVDAYELTYTVRYIDPAIIR